LDAEGPGHVGAFVGAEATFVYFLLTEGGVVLFHGAEVGGEEIGDELKIEGEVLGDFGREHGDDGEVNGENLGFERQGGGGA